MNEGSGKKALVAGGAGFIGSHLTDLLLAKRYEVTVVDCLVTGREKNIEAATKKGARFVRADIRDLESLAASLDFAGSGTSDSGKFDEIYNLASPASPVDFAKLPIFIMETASLGHRALLEIAKRHEARILFASSSEVYGDAEVHPQSESYFGNVNPIGPRGCYDEAKRFGESLNVAYHREHGVQTRTARIFNTYGPRMRPNDGRIIPNFFMQALQGQPLTVYGEGTQTRSFCYVSDQVDGLYRLMQSSELRPVNIGNPTETSVMEIASMIGQLANGRADIRHLPLPENDPKLRRPDIARARDILRWSPDVELAVGLKACHENFVLELKEAGGSIHAPTIAANYSTNRSPP